MFVHYNQGETIKILKGRNHPNQVRNKVSCCYRQQYESKQWSKIQHDGWFVFPFLHNHRLWWMKVRHALLKVFLSSWYLRDTSLQNEDMWFSHGKILIFPTFLCQVAHTTVLIAQDFPFRTWFDYASWSIQKLGLDCASFSVLKHAPLPNFVFFPIQKHTFLS